MRKSENEFNLRMLLKATVSASITPSMMRNSRINLMPPKRNQCRPKSEKPNHGFPPIKKLILKNMKENSRPWRVLSIPS
jgi:hypothetical protein